MQVIISWEESQLVMTSYRNVSGDVHYNPTAQHYQVSLYLVSDPSVLCYDTYCTGGCDGEIDSRGTRNKYEHKKIECYKWVAIYESYENSNYTGL